MAYESMGLKTSALQVDGRHLASREGRLLGNEKEWLAPTGSEGSRYSGEEI